jgi:glyoxylase-like metal-dependent hydrolase (beta-lactamase superfamily II)
MKKYSFIARMPNEPGALHTAAEVIMHEGGNINRIHFDQRIDPQTVFFEVTCTEASYTRIREGLARLGYLQDTLGPLHVLKFSLFLPHEPGALFAFLNHTTGFHANISSIDFDDLGSHPDRVTITLSLGKHEEAEWLLDSLKSHYRIEILEYDSTGEKLDDTVFYLRFAQQIREITGSTGDPFLFSFLTDINHAVQELMNLGEDPKKIFESILLTGRTLKNTTAERFFADIQIIPLAPDSTLVCIQPPCGGNIYLIETRDGCTMIDTGYGIYARDIAILIGNLFPRCKGRISHLIITHADADHCGAGGVYGVPAELHPGTMDIIRAANRAHGSRSETLVLEEIYTGMINMFSDFRPPEEVSLFPIDPIGERGGFPVLAKTGIGAYEFEVLEGLGGHLHGQVYLYCHALGLLFTADTIINLGHLSPARAAYNSLAVILVTSVNVDRELAKTERDRLLNIARTGTGSFSQGRTGCLLCCGHGPVSVLSGETLVPYGSLDHYTPVG